MAERVKRNRSPAWDVVCPYCEALPGNPCVTGWNSRWPHTQRGPHESRKKAVAQAVTPEKQGGDG